MKLFLFLLTLLISTGIHEATNITRLEPCGITNPAVPLDCSAYNTRDDSCCYYSYASLHGCVWLGQKFFGSGNYGGLTVTCADSMFIRGNMLSYLSIIILFII